MGTLVGFGNGKKSGLSDTNPGGVPNANDRGDKLDNDDSEAKKVRPGKAKFANGGSINSKKRK